MTDAQETNADSCAALFPREQEPRPSLVLRTAVDAVDECVVSLGRCSQNRALSGGRALRLHRSTIETTRGKPAGSRQSNTGVLYKHVSCSRTRATRIPTTLQGLPLCAAIEHFSAYVAASSCTSRICRRAFERPSCPKDVLFLESMADQHHADRQAVDGAAGSTARDAR